MAGPGQSNQQRLIYDGSTRAFGGCSAAPVDQFCCSCFWGGYEQTYFCLNLTQENIIACAHAVPPQDPLGYCQEHSLNLSYACPDSPCSAAKSGTGSGVLDLRITFSGLRSALNYTLADDEGRMPRPRTNPNVRLTVAMQWSLPRRAYFEGRADSIDGKSGVIVTVERNMPETAWILHAYLPLVLPSGQLANALYFVGGGNNWDKMLAGETIESENFARRNGPWTSILAETSGRVAVSLT